jgi:ABC-2 type transport system permease protein
VTPRALAAQARVELLVTVRRPESVLVTLGIPIGVLVFFAKFDALSDVGDPVDFLVPGILALAVMSTAMVSLGIATGYERRYGVLKRLGATPLTRFGLLAAKTLNVLAIEMMQVTLIVAAGLALGWDVTGGIFVAVIVLLIGTVAFAGVGMLLAGTLRAEANLAVVNGLFLVLLFLGGMAYPLHRLPGGLQAVAKALPAAPLALCARGVLASPAHLPVGSFAVLCAWAVGAPLVAARVFSWEE